MIIKQNNVIEDIKEELDSNKEYFISVNNDEIEILEIDTEGNKKEITAEEISKIEEKIIPHKFKKKVKL